MSESKPIACFDVVDEGPARIFRWEGPEDGVIGLSSAVMKVLPVLVNSLIEHYGLEKVSQTPLSLASTITWYRATRNHATPMVYCPRQDGVVKDTIAIH